MSDRTFPTIIEIAKEYPHYDCLYVTATTGGVHAKGSYHYRGEAVDFGAGDGSHPSQDAALKKLGISRFELMDKFAAWLYGRSSFITELVHTHVGDTGGYYVKNGVRKAHGFYGKATDVAHINHVHLAIRTQSEANKMLADIKSGSHPAPGNPTLHYGANNQSVKTLQADLNRKGYHLVVDGDFGLATLKAVDDFQRKSGLKVDGIVGPRTWDKLR